MQIFCTTNKETLQRGEDLDFVLVEIEDKKLKFWKTYFDTGKNPSFSKMQIVK